MLELGSYLKEFNLLNTVSGNDFSSSELDEAKPSLVMFICNHCPYVKAVTKDIVEDCNELKKIGINSVAICANKHN